MTRSNPLRSRPPSIAHLVRATRDVSALLASSAAADVMHVAWTKLESQA